MQAPPARPQPVEHEIEAVLSRGAGMHVVPTFAGWFSWKEIHPIEKQTLCTFFDGKSEKRTPEIYLGIRNFIMSKFHFKPQVHLESKDLSELSVGEMDAHLEVLEFLTHWGLVNFHPFPPGGQECELVQDKSNADTEEKISLVEKLFQFETVQSYLVPVPTKADFITPAHAVSLLSEPTLAEDAVTPAESSVEYHCNSCSVDCSRKRYHCRTQADFDFCSDCYNEGKFDEGMSQADFILMESAETPGSGGTSWTDQETLLLLEALEIFQGNKWDDIAEHVATKSKSQCMLYFLQMPILDSFLDGEDFNQTFKSIKEQSLAENDTFDVPERMEAEGNAEGKESADEKTPKQANANAAEAGTNLDDCNVSATKNSGDNGVIASSTVDESNKSSDTDRENKKTSAEFCVSGEHVSNFVADVLGSAFEAVCHFPEKKDMGSFADAGNPVMALAAFLAGLAEHADAVTSCYSSLRAISQISPALQLATRHCFILQDPPNDLKGATVSASPARTHGEQQKGDDVTPNADDTVKDSGKKEESGLTLEKQDAAASPGDKTDPERVEGDKLSSEGLPADISPSQGKIEQEKIKHAPAALSSIQHESCRTASGITEEPNSNKNIAANDESIKRLRRAAGTAISAAAVKAKLLADLEEDQIRPLAALVIEKQFQKIEVKMSFLAEIENLVLRARGLNENIRKKLLMERNAIIASRMAAAQSRPNQQGAAGTRLPVGYDVNQHLTRP